MLIGLPASGKSSWAANFISQNPELNFKILSTDYIIEEKGFRDGLDYGKSHEKNIRFAIAEMDRRFRQYIENGFHIIHDQTNLTTKIRKQHLAKVTDYFKSALVFILSEKIRVQRFNNRKTQTGKDIPEFILKNMVKGFEMPTKSEGFDKIINIEL